MILLCLFVISVQMWEPCSPAKAFAGLCMVRGSDVRWVGCDSNRKRKLPIHKDGWELWELSDFPERKKKNKNVGSHLLRDVIRKKQMGREMAPESDG